MTEFQRLQEALNRLPAAQREMIAAELLHELADIQEAGTRTDQENELTALELVPYDRIAHLAGILEGPDDLSTNPKHMEGFGQSSLL